MKKEPHVNCSKCGERITMHPKCKHCEILLHKENKEYNCRCGVQHGIISKDKVHCVNCYSDIFHLKVD